MNSLSLQNLRGIGQLSPVKLAAGDTTAKANGRGTVTQPLVSMKAPSRGLLGLALGQPQTEEDDFGFNLDPNFAPWWKPMPLPKVVQSASTGAQATPPGGQLRTAKTGYRESYPVTPSNDERNIPLPSGEPLLRLASRKFTRDYPHTTIDYNDLRPQVWPDIGPTPPGWMAPPRIDREEARAMNAVVGAPAAYPEDMTTDISGFGSLHDAFMGRMHDIPGMVTSYDQLTATQAVTDQAKAAQAAGASPSTIEQIIQTGAQAAALALQAKALIKPTATPVAAPVQPKPSLATTLLAADQPIYKRPLFLAGVAVLLGVGGYVAFSGGSNGSSTRRYRRGSTTRRYRR